MARRTRYTPELASRIVEAVSTGLTYKDAALVAGIHETTLQRWIRRYAHFATQLERARAERTQLWLAKIEAAGERDWRAYAELLDRCAPEYRKKSLVEHGGADGGPIPIRFVIVDERRPPDHTADSTDVPA